MLVVVRAVARIPAAAAAAAVVFGALAAAMAAASLFCRGVGVWPEKNNEKGGEKTYLK